MTLPTTLHVGNHSFFLEQALPDDVPGLVALLRDDPLGATREHDDLVPYRRAFAQIDRDPAHLLLVVRGDANTLVGTMQLTLLPGLARGAVTRLQVEAVRVSAPARGAGLGSALFVWAADYGRASGAALVQLTTDRRREGARRFYERLGFVATHEGMKREL